MPNWNSNNITIVGPAEKIRQLWEAAKTADDGEFGLLSAMCPIPENLKNPETDQVANEAHNWRVANWGVKWDVDDKGLVFSELEDGQASINGYAMTPWSPPLEAFRSYVSNNPDVFAEILYYEPGVSFIGLWDSDGGNDFWDDVGSLLNTTKEQDPTLYMLLDHFNAWDNYDTNEDEDEDEDNSSE